MATRKKTRTKATPRTKTAPRPASPRKASKPVAPPECLYLGCFFFDDVLNDKDCTGTFQMVVSASTPEQSIDRFRKRLRAIHRLGNVLTSPCTVYLEGVVPLIGSFKEGLMVNCEFRPAPDPPDYQVTNMLPPQGITTPGSFVLTYGKDEAIQPFVDFGGLAHQRAVERAKEASSPVSGWPVQPPKPRLSAEERKKQKDEAVANRARRQVEREAKEKTRKAAAEEKTKRAAVLKATFSELGPVR